MRDCLIVGGGVVGLSLAYDLAGHGLTVQVVEAGLPGREASWAGAGIFPPAGEHSADPIERLTVLSNRLHARWADALQAETGIDTGYRRCGGLHLAANPADASALRKLAAQWHTDGIAVHEITSSALADLEPRISTDGLQAAYLLNDEHQLRNTRHLKALLAACERRGVQITCGAVADDFVIDQERVRAVVVNGEPWEAGTVCVTAGAWSRRLMARLGAEGAIKPIRGQIVLLATPRPLLTRIVKAGPRYLVPRPDGRLLVGSTEEDVGFDRRNTSVAISELLNWARRVVPATAEAQFERCWAGLRPGTDDRLPYLGRVPGLRNAFVAAGHYRGGLQLSTGTAVVMSSLIRGEQPPLDISAFALDRAKPR